MDRSTRPISIAIQAMGGQGGGVLADWIVGVAEASGYIAQATSVPGVAQRTGSTIYYLEIFSEHAARKAGQDPVLSLMPSPGDVDVVIAAEFMEAGRVVHRGLVTPTRTTLIASTHRVYAISEKSEMGDGILDDNTVLDACKNAARKFVYFDMEAVAESHRSVISSALLGALAGTQSLPFERADFEDAIRRGGIGVEASLAAFDDAYKRAQGEPEAPAHSRPRSNVAPSLDTQLGRPEASAHSRAVSPEPRPKHPVLKDRLEHVRKRFPPTTHFYVVEGMRRCADYQDPAYVKEYIKRLESILDCDAEHGGEDRQYLLTSETARYLALWMTYHDTVRVADYKIRGSRFGRFKKEVRAQDDQLIYVTEFMHPRLDEICDMLPAWLGGAIMKHRWLQLPFRPFLGKGRKIHTAKLSGFMLLWLVSRIRPWRRVTLRYKTEMKRIEVWLSRIRETAASNYPLAVEIARCQRLVKGYSDTYARGLASFDKIMAVIDGYPSGQAPAQVVHRLIDAALADEMGNRLAEEIAALKESRPQEGKSTASEESVKGGEKAEAGSHA